LKTSEKKKKEKKKKRKPTSRNLEIYVIFGRKISKNTPPSKTRILKS